MIKSMTAFGRGEVVTAWGKVTCELRAVNHRHSELALHVPDTLRPLESALRKQINTVLKRGRISCAINHHPPPGNDQALAIDEALLRQIMESCERVCACKPTGSTLNGTLNPIDILHWPGVLKAATVDIGKLSASVEQLLDDTLQGVQAERCREGEALHTLIVTRTRAARDIVDTLREKLPELLSHQRHKLLQRAKELAIDVEPTRLEQELLFLAQKYDIAEELDRLGIHLGELDKILARHEPIGRRLDFMVQELNREANTLGAKAMHLSITTAAVDLKVLFEQIREQVQNVE